MKRHRGCRIGGSFGASEIPLPLLFFYLFDEAELGFTAQLLVSRSFVGRSGLKTLSGVLRGTHEEQKSSVEQKGKSPLDFDFQCEYKP